MTKREKAIKDRFWLKVRRFAITNSLYHILESRLNLLPIEREFCCYIQSKVLRETHDDPARFVNIGARYWQSKCGGTYSRWIALLVTSGELIVNDRYLKGQKNRSGFTKSYRIPSTALASGLRTIDFKGKVKSLKDRTILSNSDGIIAYVHECASRLTVPIDLLPVQCSIRDASAHDYSRRIFFGDFNIRYGPNGGRLYHSIIEMPCESRSNLVFKDSKSPLIEYDIKSCHPVLLLPLISCPLEKERYCVLLDHDIYSTIRSSMNATYDRDGLKTQFLIYVNRGDRSSTSRNPIHRFFSTHFPIFTNEILNARNDLAVYLQREESQIMVQDLGTYCRENKLFWIPCHDGWMGIEDGQAQIIRKVSELFFERTGYHVQITNKTLSNPYYYSSLLSILSIFPSYVHSKPTSLTSDYRRLAEDWLKNLPKHPEPDEETLRMANDARQRQRMGHRAVKKGIHETEQLRKELAPLWAKFQNRSSNEKGVV